MENEKYYLTRQKLEELRKEYQELRELRKIKSKKGAPSAFHSEELNIEFVSFQEDLGLLDSRIEEIENILNNFELIKPPAKKERDKVHLGAQVTVEVNGKDCEFTIVGTLETDPFSGKISNESPVGKALLGRKVGDEVVISFPTRMLCKIKKIKYPAK